MGLGLNATDMLEKSESIERQTDSLLVLVLQYKKYGVTPGLSFKLESKCCHVWLKLWPKQKLCMNNAHLSCYCTCGHWVCCCEGSGSHLLPHTSLHWRSTDYCIHKGETPQNHNLDTDKWETDPSLVQKAFNLPNISMWVKTTLHRWLLSKVTCICWLFLSFCFKKDVWVLYCMCEVTDPGSIQGWCGSQRWPHCSLRSVQVYLRWQPNQQHMFSDTPSTLIWSDMGMTS